MKIFQSNLNLYHLENMELINQNIVSHLQNNLYSQINLKNSKFEDAYVKLRQKESRVWKIEELKALHIVARNSIHSSEWKIRFKSAKKILDYFKSKNEPLTILELGCGNGWLSNILSTIDNSTIVGLDINLFELKQASEAFCSAQNITFVYGNIFDKILSNGSFDAVILAASIQYFENLDNLFDRLFELLNTDGEIHIMDSPMYSEDQLLSAKSRTIEYFTLMDYPELKNHYFHHHLETLNKYNFQMMYNPSTIQNRILRRYFLKNMSPFPWIRVKKK